MDRPISEQAVIDTIYESRNNFKNEFDQGFFADKIRELPPVTPKPKTGYWINIDDIESECSECGHRELNERFIFEDINFCAKCGAKMQEVAE